MSRAAVAASTDLAARAGARLAEAGGNAVDAALSAALVSMVVEPGVCSLGGGAYVTILPPGGAEPVVVDGDVEMPGRGLPPERFARGAYPVTMTYGGGVTTHVGHGSVATPGAVPAVHLAHQRYGRAPWAELVAPAWECARDGFPLTTASHHYLTHTHDLIYGWHADSRAALHAADGHLLAAGDPVHVPHLADSLALLAEEGASAFTTGAVGRKVAADMAAHDGLLTADDLAAYEALVRPALPVPLGRWRLATNPPPAIGGVVLAAMLTLMGDRPAGTWTDEDLALLVDVQEAVLRWRLDHLDVARDRVAAAGLLLDLAGSGGLTGARRSPSTITVSAVDADGGACAVTASAGYGSGVLVPGTGLWLNNCLGEPELNRGGLHTQVPGERLASNMAPTVGVRDDGATLAIGSPGADRITTALTQVLLSYVQAGLSLVEAVDRARLHVRFGEAGVVVEHEEDLVLPDLPLPTHPLPSRSMYFGGVAFAVRRPDGSFEAAADPRRTGAVAISG